MSTRELSVRITGDPRSLSRAFRSVDRDMGRMEKASDRLRRSFRGLGRAAALGAGVAAAGFAAGAVKATKAASNLEESVNKSRETFETAGPAMEKWASTAAASLGMSKAAALENAASIGAMLKPMGVAPKRAAEMSRTMAELASDMASFNNEDPTEMLDRIRAGLSGESEPLKRFGAVLSETRVKQHAYKVGIAETGAELTEQQKIQARYSLLLKDTADQQGDFARTADGAANAQRIFKARMEDISATAGRIFLPVFTRALGVANDFLAVVEQRWPQIQAVAVRVFSAVRSAVDPLVVRFREAWPQIRDVVVDSLTTAWGTAREVFTALVPMIRRAIEVVVPIVVGMGREILRVFRALAPRVRPLIEDLARLIRAVIERIAAFWDRWGEDIMAIVRRVFDAVVKIAKPLLEALRGAIQAITGLIEGDWSKAFGGLKKVAVNLLKGAFQAIKGLGSLALDAMKSLGKAIVRGIVSGIKSVAGEIADAILDAIPGPLRRLLPGGGPSTAAATADIGRFLTRARGGPIPGPRGRAVPVIAHGGEVILNEGQQRIVGIDRIVTALRATGGIVGGDGAAFARGGWVNPAPGTRLGGGPGQGTHSYTAPPNNWQSDSAYDLMGRDGGPVVAAGPGVISAVRPFSSDPRFWGYGLYLNTRGIQLYYKHLKSVRVRPGQTVGAGQLLGELGSGVNGGPHLHLGSTSLSALHSIVRAPAVSPGATGRGEDVDHFTPEGERAPNLTPRQRLARTIRGAGIRSGVSGIVNRVMQAGADVSAAVGARLSTSSSRGQRAVNAAGRAAAAAARAAGKSPEEVAAAAQQAEREKQGNILRGDIRRVRAALSRLAARWKRLRRDLLRVGRGGGPPSRRRQALNRIRAAMRQNRRERDELLELQAELVDELRELNEEIAQEQYEEQFAGGDEGGEGPPTEADFADAALAQAALTPGLEDDLSAARGIEDLARREYEAALASGDPRRIADTARALLSARQQRESIEEQIKVTRENTEALRDLNRTFGGSVAFGYRGQDYVLRSLAPPSSDRLVGMEV